MANPTSIICVRRAFLCGEDACSGRNYEHSRAWIRDRVRFLSGLFGMEVFACEVLWHRLGLLGSRFGFSHVREESIFML